MQKCMSEFVNVELHIFLWRATEKLLLAIQLHLPSTLSIKGVQFILILWLKRYNQDEACYFRRTCIVSQHEHLVKVYVACVELFTTSYIAFVCYFNFMNSYLTFSFKELSPHLLHQELPAPPPHSVLLTPDVNSYHQQQPQQQQQSSQEYQLLTQSATTRT